MGLLERLFGRSDAAGNPSGTASPAHRYPESVPYLDGTSVLALSAVWRCVTLIADAIAGCPWSEWRGPEESPERLPSSRLVRRPFQLMTRREWTWRVVATEALYNTCHLLHVGGTDTEGAPWSLLPVPPAAIAPIGWQDPYYLLPPDRYIVGGQRVTADQLTIIRRAPFPGVPDSMAAIIRLARREFATVLAADVHASRYWQAGGPTVTQITSDQELDDPQAAKIAQRWADRRSMGADFPAVLGKGAKADPWGADPTSESAVEARREMVADIGRYFGVPTRKLNAPSVGNSETYANVEDEAVDFERDTLRGYGDPIEDAISELLPGDYIGGRRMRFDMLRLTQGNLESRSRAYPPLVTAGIIGVDEARARGFGLGPRTTEAEPAAPREALPAAVLAATPEVVTT